MAVSATFNASGLYSFIVYGFNVCVYSRTTLTKGVKVISRIYKRRLQRLTRFRTLRGLKRPLVGIVCFLKMALITPFLCLLQGLSSGCFRRNVCSEDLNRLSCVRI